MMMKFTTHLVVSMAASLIAVSAVDLESAAKLETKTKTNLTQSDTDTKVAEPVITTTAPTDPVITTTAPLADDLKVTTQDPAPEV